MMKTVKEAAEIGVVVARFQVPFLHEEHVNLIQRVVSTHPRVFIILGLAADSCKCTYNNPLDFQTRKAMVEQAFPGTEVTYIKDVGNDEIWSAQLDKIIKEQAGPGQKVVLYGGRDSFIPHYKGKYPTEELVPSKYLSGKEIRKNVGIKSKHTQEFREGVVWAVENQWPVVLPTVDIAIFDRPNGKILMGRKPNQTRYRFIGGFADVNSPSFEADAIREVSEETGLVIKNPKYIASVRIDDWRYRGERNKITTTFFIADYEGGEPIGNSDIADVKWISVGDLHDDKFAKENIVPEHHVLIDALVEHLIDTPQVA